MNITKDMNLLVLIKIRNLSKNYQNSQIGCIGVIYDMFDIKTEHRQGCIGPSGTIE